MWQKLPDARRLHKPFRQNTPYSVPVATGMQHALRRCMGVGRFEDLVVWQEARKYCAAVGLATDTPEFFRDGALRPRMNKTALSIMENIAEGFERESLREFSHFLRIAKGSTGEARAQLYAAKDRALLPAEEFERLFTMNTSIGKMLRRLRESLPPAPRTKHQGPRTKDQGLRTKDQRPTWIK